MFYEGFPDVYGLDKHILGEHSLLYCPNRKGARYMKCIDSSFALRKFLTDEARKQTKSDPDQDKFHVSFAFGCAVSDFITSPSYFDEQKDDIFTFSQEDKIHPREKVSTSKASLDSKQFPVKLSSYILRLYQDKDSPIHHGFTQEHRNIMFNRFSLGELRSKITPFLTSAILMKENDPLFQLFFVETFRDESVLSNCFCQPEKGKFPPSDIGKDVPPLLRHWATKNGVNVGTFNKKESTSSHLSNLSLIFARKSEFEIEKMKHSVELEKLKMVNNPSPNVAQPVSTNQKSLILNFKNNSFDKPRVASVSVGDGHPITEANTLHEAMKSVEKKEEFS